jgi:hypothetical protein
MYHLSITNGICDLEPQVPKRLSNGENATIRRICFSESIEGCIRSLQPSSYSNKFDYHYVYKTVGNIEPHDILSNEELVRQGLVPDAKFTGELWVLTPVKIELVSRIAITSDSVKIGKSSSFRYTEYLFVGNNRVEFSEEGFTIICNN